jgi:hypothetical protein
VSSDTVVYGPRVERVADGVYGLGSRWVNWYVLEADGQVTVVDGGYLG